jgi:hypothetical protein
VLRKRSDLFFIPSFKKKHVRMVGVAVGTGLARIQTNHPGISKESNEIKTTPIISIMKMNTN